MGGVAPEISPCNMDDRAEAPEAAVVPVAAIFGEARTASAEKGDLTKVESSSVTTKQE
jgi:hypothetical protein